MTDLRQHAVEIHEQFSEQLDVTVDEIAERLETLVSEYRVPVEEAPRSVVSTYLDEADMSRDQLAGGDQAAEVADIDAPEEWLDLTAKVVELWEPRADSIAQVGLLGDETGTVKFTKWAKSDLAELEEGAVYRLGNLVTDEYEGRFSVKLNSTTTIEAVDEDIEVGDDATEIEGALVDIQSGSGLIKRCPESECTRVLQNGRCSEHGDVEGEFDLRIKGVLDDGGEVHEVIFDQEATEELTGIGLEEAQEMAAGAGNEHVEAAEIDEPEQWVDLTAKVVELWEARSDAVAQVGLLGDETGTVKFTAWAKSDPPTLEEGAVYELGNLVTDEYEGRFSVKINSTSTVREVDREMEVGDDSVEIEGALVAVQSGSGLIKRCPKEDCTRVLDNGRCSEHGDVEGEFDLRIKGVVDDGHEVHEVILDREATEELTGTSLAEAKDMAMDALDTEVVAEEMKADVLGWYYRVRGPTFRRYVLAETVERLDGPVDTESTLVKARSI